MKTGAISTGEAITDWPVAAARAGVPWHFYAAVFGAVCIPIGVLWDISWHMSIGRDTFWTPAHIVIYLGGLIPGLTSGWLIFKTTFFGTPEEKAGSVCIWGASGPLGAWVVVWGAVAMLTAAPFDNWWHNAYGLDVKIISPPHAVLAVGIDMVALGVLLRVLALQNRMAAIGVNRGAGLFVFMAGVRIAMISVFLTEESFPNAQHASTFYLIACAIYPFNLVAAARASTLRWSATLAAATYMGIGLLMTWTLPLFSAQPMLAPIYNPITHMVPPVFPLLLVLPGIAIDLIMQRMGRGRGWRRDTLIAVTAGIGFLSVFLAAQWLMSSFLISPAAENWFFAGNRVWPYTSSLGSWTHEFWNHDHHALNAIRISIMLLFAVISSGAGLAIGNWLSKVRR